MKVGAPKGAHNSKRTEFKKGFTPWNKGLFGAQVAWNKGMSGTSGYSETRFKKWDTPWNKGTKGLTVGWNKGMGRHFICAQCSISFTPKARGRSTKYCSKSCQGKGMTGNKHWGWIEDRTLLSDDHHDRGGQLHREWSKSVKNRDGWVCKISNGDCSGQVVAHHILSWKEHVELRYEVNNGITLCQFHHPRKRNDEVRLSPYFQEMVNANQFWP